MLKMAFRLLFFVTICIALRSRSKFGSRSKTEAKFRGQLQKSRSTILCAAVDITSNKMYSCPSKID